MTEAKDEVPHGWTRVRVSQLASLVNGYPFDSNDFTSDGEVPLVRIRDLKAPAFDTFVGRDCVPEYAYVRDGDVLVGMDGDFNVALWNRGIAALNQRVCLLRAKENADGRFLAYALPDHLGVINDLTYATTVKHLASSDVLRIVLPAPDGAEQRRIADYLDEATAKLDALTDTQSRLIGTLTERRASVIDHVFEHCAADSSVRLRYLFQPSAECNRPEAEVLSVYRDHGVIPKSSRDDNHNRTPEKLDRYLFVRAGDLVVNKMKAWQGSLGISPCDGIVSPDYEVLQLTSTEFLPAYLHYVLRSPRLVSEYRARSVGIRPSQWRLYWDQLGDIRVATPALIEQRSVVERLERETVRIDILIAKARQMVEILGERRRALITAAVVGLKDVPLSVRGAA